MIALHRPKEGQSDALEALLRRHTPVLRELELVTDRPAIVARAQDGTYLEIFEWRNSEAAERAHDLPAVAAVWEGLGQVADFARLADLGEITRPFAHFATVW